MKLLNVKATLILTLSAIFMVSSVFADVGNKKLVSQVKAEKEYAQSKIEVNPQIRLAPEFYNARTKIVDKGNGFRDTELTINIQDSYGDGWNGNVLMIGDNSFTLDNINDDGTNASFSMTLADGLYPVTCGGGSWMSEVSWEIVETSSGTELLVGGAPYDGWLQLGEASEVLGCMDTEALNYGYNCAGENVGDPTVDDGCCQYPAPPNDLCEDAEAVTGPYPVEITATSENATIDCEGYLNWNAVWYELDLPYENNIVDIINQYGRFYILVTPQTPL